MANVNLDSLTINNEILKMISEIDEFKGSWRSLSMLAPERLQALKKVATIESIGSSTRIEGSKLTDLEIETILSNIEIQSLDSRDEQEVIGYSHVMNIIFDAWKDIPISENYIKQLHGEILKYSSKDYAHRGKYKTSSNSIAAFDSSGKNIGIVFETATPFETPIRMKELVDWINSALEENLLHPILICAIFIVVFLEIHPFQDGNGRLSRVLTTLILLKSGYSYVSYSSLESIIEQNKDAYYLSLRETQKTLKLDDPDWMPWIIFFLNALNKQIKRLMLKIEKEQMLLQTLPETSLMIVEHIKAHGRVTLSEMVTLTSINRNTLKKHFKKLVSMNQINQHGKGRGVWYSLT
ncbi:Fic family protein [Cysteiniphilum marinum]|uniref:Fic family protein n=2 Tax=Fastidiosibacteraceae TaxID=2056687 RepID=UPI001784306E|nr:Fic family protein [Cysteiniphilum marinum]